MSGRVRWLRSNGFVLALFVAGALGFVFPAPGARGGWLHPELASNGGIALILLLQGLSLAVEKIKSGASNWRLYVIIQAFTFVVFPLAGGAFQLLTRWIWVTEPQAIRDGFLFLCVLPSTVSTSVVLTAVAGGNVAGALFNAALSNLVGVVLTPVLVQLLMRSTGQTAPFGPLIVKILLLTLLPFFVGMALRPRVRHWVEARKAWVARISNAVIVFIVYCSFADSVREKVWETNGLWMTGQVVAGVALLFGAMSALIAMCCRWFGLGREDFIAAYFCSVKKTLAMGVPLALLIFGQRKDVSLILLPIMFYHPLQLLVNGILANRWAKAT